ncbi:hypothetical protein KRP22_012853 [Phytophthora ramorum]|nr:hypothetical protein KRP22_8719 [Phytophthora ramorum]
MWMQKSVEGSSFSSSGNFHDRNRFGAPYASGGSYGGSSVAVDGAGDWKSKILESGQWLGGKVIEYGGKLARGPTSDSIPDHYAPQMPRNDGRANWMADIRSSSTGGGVSGGYSGSGGGYQNDFATERPKAYSDYGNGSKPYEPKSVSSNDHGHHHAKGRHAKKKHEEKKSKKSKKSRKKQQSESESESELSISESETEDERSHKKSKAKKHSGFYSESESEEESRKKPSADYAFSFDPAKLPPPPAEEEKVVKKSKAKKSKKDKSSKKSRARRQSVASTDESASEKESTRKAKKRSSKKAAVSVDLLGVDLDAQPATTGLPAQEVQPSIFDASPSQNPLQDLAGLSFAAAPVQAAAPTQQSIFDGSAPAMTSDETQSQPQQADAFRTNLLPENNIVDLSSLASEKKKSLSANPAEKRTLNDLQKARGVDQSTPVMAMPMQGQPQMQNVSGGMMQLSMNMHQPQLTDGSAAMQQQMYPQMHMQGMSQPQMQQMMMMQPQMNMMAQPQMMNMQMMQQQQQQFAQGGAATVPTGAQQNSQGSDPYRQLP